jgi:hypothetical protein
MARVVKYFVLKRSPLRRSCVLACLLMAATLCLAQRGHHRLPTPAEHGMLLPKQLPAENPKPESPEVNDPNAGDVPDDPFIQGPIDDEYHASEDEEPTVPTIQLQIFKVVCLRVGPGSEIGRVGDKVILITGRGFHDTESSPIVHLGDDIHLEEVYVAEKGTSLIALLPAAIANGLSARDLSQVAVQNPGGLNRDPSRWARMPLEKIDFLRELSDALPARFQRGTYFVEQVGE